MNKIVWAVAAALPLLLVACEKKESTLSSDPPRETNNSSEQQVARDSPGPTEEEKVAMRAALDDDIKKSPSASYPLTGGWQDALDRDLRINYVKCRLPNGNPTATKCHLYVDPYDPQVPDSPVPIRFMRVGMNGQGSAVYSVFIRSKQYPGEFMFCPQMTELGYPTRIEGECTFNPHPGAPPDHYVVLRLVRSHTKGTFTSVYFRFHDLFALGSKENEVHNGEGHGGDL